MLYRRGGQWWYRFKFHGADIRESAGTTSKEVARRTELKRRRELEEGAAGVRRKSPKMFRAAAAEWTLLKSATFASSTLRAAKQDIRHLTPHFGRMLLSDIEASDVAAYQIMRTAAGAAAATVNLEIGTLRSILRRNGFWAEISPDVRMLRVREGVGKALSEGEEKRLLDSCRASRSRSLLPAVLLALNTGLRRQELLSARWHQVDFDRRQLRVGDSKTRHGQGRLVPLNDAALSTLALWAKNFPDRTLEDFIFPSEHYGEGGVVYGVDPTQPAGTLKEAWETAKQRTGDEEKGILAVECRWHDLRHTFFSRLLERGAGLELLARIMGWSAGTTVRMSRVYGHVSADVLAGVVGLLDAPENRGGGAQKVAQSAPRGISAVSN